MSEGGPLTKPLPWDLVAKDYAVEVVPQFENYAADALRLARVGPGTELVDVACGPGTASVLAARLGADVQAIDFSPAMLAVFRGRLVHEELPIEVQEGDGQALPFGDARFDVGISI